MSEGKQMKVCITGGAGFIGSNAARFFLRKGWEVVIFDNFRRSGAEKNLAWLKNDLSTGERLKVVRGDVTNEHDCTNLHKLMGEVDYVLHLAAQVAVTTSVLNPRDDFLNNAFGTLNLLEAIRLSSRRPALIYASTNKVYGSLHGVLIEELEKRYSFKNIQAISEEQLLDFHSPYGCSKGSADQYVRDYARIYELETIVCRQSCIYGPRQFGVEDQGWAAWFMIAAATGKDITIYGNGKQVRDLLYIDDLVELYSALFDSIKHFRGRVFNVGGGPMNTLSLIEFIGLLEDKIGRPLRYKKAKERPGDQPIYVSDVSLLKNEVGWQPKVAVSEGIEKLWQWVYSNQSLFDEALVYNKPDGLIRTTSKFLPREED